VIARDTSCYHTNLKEPIALVLLILMSVVIW